MSISGVGPQILSCSPNRAFWFLAFLNGHLRLLFAVLRYFTRLGELKFDPSRALANPFPVTESWHAVHSSALIDGWFWTG